MILAASAMPAGAQGVAATANWVTPINANNGISTPETVAASDNNTFLVSKFVSKGNDNSLNFVNFGSQEKVAFGAPNKATSGNDNLLLTKVNADGTAGGPAFPAYWGGSTAHSAGKLGEDLPTDALHCLTPNRQLSAAFFPGTLSRHSRIFHCHGVYSPGGLKSRDMTSLFFHLAHIMNESSSCDDCPGQLCRVWIFYKKVK